MPAPREPQDRKTPTRPRVRKPTAAELAATDQTVGARAEADSTDWLEVEMGGYTYRMTRAEQWRQSTNDALNQGRMNDWAGDVMPEEDYLAWLDADPTNAEVGDFMEEMGRVAGASLGESRASRRAYARMASR